MLNPGFSVETGDGVWIPAFAGMTKKTTKFLINGFLRQGKFIIQKLEFVQDLEFRI